MAAAPQGGASPAVSAGTLVRLDGSDYQATASIIHDEIATRRVVNPWQMLRNVSAVDLVEGPEGVVPLSLFQRMPPVPEIHGIEVFAGPASIPSEYAGDQRDMICGLIVVWTR